MSLNKYILKVSIFLPFLAFLCLNACMPNFGTETNTPTASLVPTKENLQQNIWNIQKCQKLPSVIPDGEHVRIEQYVGDIKGRGEMNMLLNFTQDNEIEGFAFDFKQVQEYRVNGCIDGRVFTMWLQQEDAVETVIKGEFPETDPRGHFSSTELTFEVMTGSLEEKDNLGSLQVYFRLEGNVAGTMDQRFPLTGLDDDKIILDAVRHLRDAITRDDHDQVVELIRFPLEFIKDTDDPKEILSAEAFLAQYDIIFDEAFRERITNAFPNYLWGNAGNFAGTVSHIIYDGGLILFDEQGKVIAIYNWKE